MASRGTAVQTTDPTVRGAGAFSSRSSGTCPTRLRGMSPGRGPPVLYAPHFQSALARGRWLVAAGNRSGSATPPRPLARARNSSRAVSVHSPDLPWREHSKHLVGDDPTASTLARWRSASVSYRCRGRFHQAVTDNHAPGFSPPPEEEQPRYPGCQGPASTRSPDVPNSVEPGDLVQRASDQRDSGYECFMRGKPTKALFQDLPGHHARSRKTDPGCGLPGAGWLPHLRVKPGSKWSRWESNPRPQRPLYQHV